ncbi:hypothetical protein HXX76_008014 [Chlamydomonas incerta]|uniref:SET domain-containing protein n=1 Tax=Chlamydomonas incerta TaxID=51695 RepID=A0A835W031_CHLIN|nr:hypothetical protein HXX76_008014 [Chlamydomonas incerta]|eukprot:KAG2434290.1 hypothetical protein HXX76_008014 [Chlamydomonas incerta]
MDSVLAVRVSSARAAAGEASDTDAGAACSSSGEDDAPLASRMPKPATAAARGWGPHAPKIRRQMLPHTSHSGALEGDRACSGRPAAIGASAVRLGGWASQATSVSGYGYGYGYGSDSASDSASKSGGDDDSDSSSEEDEGRAGANPYGGESDDPEGEEAEELEDEADCLELPAVRARGRGGGRWRAGGQRSVRGSRGGSTPRVAAAAAAAAGAGAGAGRGRGRGCGRGRGRGRSGGSRSRLHAPGQAKQPAGIARRGKAASLPLGRLRLHTSDYLFGNATLLHFFPDAVGAAVEERAAASRAGRNVTATPGSTVQLQFGAAAGSFALWVVTYGQDSQWVRLGGGKQLRRVLGLRDGAVIELEAQDLPPRRSSGGGGGEQPGAVRARVVSYGDGAAGQTPAPAAGQTPAPLAPLTQPAQPQQPQWRGPGHLQPTRKRARLQYGMDDVEASVSDQSGSPRLTGGGAAPPDALQAQPSTSRHPQPGAAAARMRSGGPAVTARRDIGRLVCGATAAGAAAATTATTSAPAHDAARAHRSPTRHDGDITSRGGGGGGEDAPHNSRLRSLLSRLPPSCIGAEGDLPAALQPGELRLCGLTFHTEVAPFVQSAMQQWEEGLSCPLASVDPARQQLESVAGCATAAAGSERHGHPAACWEAAFARHRLSRNILHSRLATLLGLSGEGGGPGAPLPEGGAGGGSGGGAASPQSLLHASVRVCPAADAGSASSSSSSCRLEVVSAVRKSWCLGLVAGYVAPRALVEEVVAAAESIASLRSSFATVAAASALLHECRPETRRLVEQRAEEEAPAAAAGAATLPGGCGPAASAAALSRLLRSLLLPLPASWRQLSGAALAGPPADDEDAVLLLDSPWAGLLLPGPEGSPAAAAASAAAGQCPDPNCMVLPVRVRGLVVLALVAVRDVAAGAPLALDRQAAWWGPPQLAGEEHHAARRGQLGGAEVVPAAMVNGLCRTAQPRQQQLQLQLHSGAAGAAPLVPLWRTYDANGKASTDQGLLDQLGGGIHCEGLQPPQEALFHLLQLSSPSRETVATGSVLAAATAATTANEEWKARPGLRAHARDPPLPPAERAGPQQQQQQQPGQQVGNRFRRELHSTPPPPYAPSSNGRGRPYVDADGHGDSRRACRRGGGGRAAVDTAGNRAHEPRDDWRLGRSRSRSPGRDRGWAGGRRGSASGQAVAGGSSAVGGVAGWGLRMCGSRVGTAARGGQADNATGSRPAVLHCSRPAALQSAGEGEQDPAPASRWSPATPPAGNGAGTGGSTRAETAAVEGSKDGSPRVAPHRPGVLHVCSAPSTSAIDGGVAGSTPAGGALAAAAAGWTSNAAPPPCTPTAAAGRTFAIRQPPPLRLVIKPGQVLKTPAMRMLQPVQQPQQQLPPPPAAAAPPVSAALPQPAAAAGGGAPAGQAPPPVGTPQGTQAELPRPLVRQISKHACRVGLAEAHRGSLKGLLDSLGSELGLGCAVKGPMLTRLDHLGMAALVAAQQLVERRALRHVQNAVLRVCCCPVPGLKLRLWHRSYVASGSAGPTWLDVRVTAHFGELLDNVAAADQASRRALSSWLYGFTTYAPAVQLEPEPTCAAADAAVCAALPHTARVAVPLTDEAGPMFVRDNWHTRPVPLPCGGADDTTGVAAVAAAAASVAEAAAAAAAAAPGGGSSSGIGQHHQQQHGALHQQLLQQHAYGWPHAGWLQGPPPQPDAGGGYGGVHQLAAPQPGIYGYYGYHQHQQ